MGAHSSLPNGSTASNHGKGRHRKRKHHRLEPYAWLGAGALTMGLGAAALTGAGVAQAADDGGSSSSSSSSSSSGDSGASSGSSSSGSTGSKDDSSGGSSSSDKSEDSESGSGASSASGTASKAKDDADDSAKDDESDSKTLKKAVAVEDVDTVDTETVDRSEERSAKKAVSVDLATPDETVEEIKATEPAADDPAPDVAAVALVVAAGTAKEEKVVAAVQEPEVTPGVEEPAASGATLMSVAAEQAALAATASLTASPSVIGTLPTNAGILSLDGTRLYSMSSSADHDTIVKVLNTSTGELVSSIQINDQATLGSLRSLAPLVISPDGSKLYVVGWADGLNSGSTERQALVVTINTTSNVIANSITIQMPATTARWLTPEAAAIGPDGRLYIAIDELGCSGGCTAPSGRLLVVNLAAKSVDAYHSVFDTWSDASIYFSPDAKHYYLSYGDITAFDMATDVQIGTVQLDSGSIHYIPYGQDSGWYPSSGVFSPDGKTLYVVVKAPGRLLTIDVATHTVTNRLNLYPLNDDGIALGGWPSGVVVSPDGSRLYIPGTESTNWGASVKVVDATTHAVISTIDLDPEYSGVYVASRDGTRLYLLNGTSGTDVPATMTVVDLTKSQVTSVVSFGGYAYSGELLISSDGKRVYARFRQFSNVPDFDIFTAPSVTKIIDTTKIGQPGGGGGSGTGIAGGIGSYEDFWDALRNGFSLASWVKDVSEVVTQGAVNVAGWGGALTITGFASGIYDIFKGIITFDPGTALGGWIDVGAGFVGLVGGTAGVAVALGIQLTKLFASFWVPLTNDQQIGFLNHVAQCYYGKNTDDLNSAQASRIAQRYDGGWGYANLLSDYSRYNARGIAQFFGGNGCP